eukprot:evm.model.scf_469.3 EVM.evm.TU.scf_469.3   scf_469:18127-25928(-)
MVQEICRDIKKLDYAKQHLTHAITALRRLAMLTKAIQSLEELLYQRESYRECANLLEAVSQLRDYFEKYGHIPKIGELTGKLENIRNALRASVFDDFKTLWGSLDSSPPPETLERLANGCLVANALGVKVSDELVGVICDREMRIYQQIYGTVGEVAKLERTERRYQWLKKRLDERAAQWAVFPESWRAPQLVCMAFCKVTKSQLAEILDQQSEGLRENVAGLLKAVVDTNKFEKEMTARFGGGKIETDDTSVEEEEAPTDDSMSASDARKRLQATLKKAKEMKAIEDGVEQEPTDLASASLNFTDSISLVFEKHLRYYVDEEYQELLDYLRSCIQEEDERHWRPSEEAGTNVLQSANQIFFRIRSSLQRCAKFISRGEPLYLLSRAFQGVLVGYAGELRKRLPKTAGGLTTVGSSLLGEDWQIKLPIEEEQVVCSMLHTAAHCSETVGTLKKAIQRDITPGYADQINFDKEEELFQGLSAQCLSVLVLGINTRLDAALTEMTKIRWDTIEATGDELSYVSTIRNVLRDCGPRLGSDLDEADFGFFCDKLVHGFVPRFYETFFKLRKVTIKGALQMAIDGEAIKTCLLGFPQSSKAGSVLPSYATFVEREMGAAISLVKVLQSKPENLVDNYLVLMPDSAQHVAEFQRAVELKSLKKSLQVDIVNVYQNRLMGKSPGAPAALSRPGRAPAHPQAAGRGGYMASFTSSSRSALFKGSKTMQETASRTRESLARMANLIPSRFSATGPDWTGQ